MIDEMRASLGIDRDARRRMEELVDQQEKELKKMREYRDASLRLKRELDDRSRERGHVESSLDGMRAELARAARGPRRGPAASELGNARPGDRVRRHPHGAPDLMKCTRT